MTHIRPIEENDFELIYDWENQPELWNVSEQHGPFSEEDIRTFMKRCLDPENSDIERWVITSEGEPLGAIDIFDFDPSQGSCGLGIFIVHTDNRFKGHATNALRLGIRKLKERNCHLIKVLIYPDNPASIRLFEKLNFKRGGNTLFKGREVYQYFLELT